MLFYSYRLGSGRDAHGHQTASWGRTSLCGQRPWLAPSLVEVGVTRVWKVKFLNLGCSGVAQTVAPGGLTGWSLTSAGINPGSYLVASLRPAPITPGLTTLLRWIPVGSLVRHLFFYGRSAGTQIKVLRHRNGFTECRLPSKKLVWLNSSYSCVVGSNSNLTAKYLSKRKAGQSRWLGKRPHTRGVAMNPVDHPHGGGQGKTSGGRPGTTPWGKLTKGYKTVRK